MALIQITSGDSTIYINPDNVTYIGGGHDFGNNKTIIHFVDGSELKVAMKPEDVAKVFEPPASEKLKAKYTKTSDNTLKIGGA